MKKKYFLSLAFLSLFSTFLYANNDNLEIVGEILIPVIIESADIIIPEIIDTALPLVIEENDENSEEAGLELFTGYGFISSNSLILNYSSLFGGLFSSFSQDINQTSQTTDSNSKKNNEFYDFGIYSLGVNFHLSKNIYTGVSGSIQSFMLYNKEPIIASSFLTSIGLEYGWPFAKFYHEFGAGLLMFSTSSDSIYTFGVNFTLLGFKINTFGNTWLYSEINLGQKGLISLGSCWRI